MFNNHLDHLLVPVVDLQTLENLTSGVHSWSCRFFCRNRKELRYPDTWIQLKRHEPWVTENVKADLKRLYTEIHHTSIKTAQNLACFCLIWPRDICSFCLQTLVAFAPLHHWAAHRCQWCAVRRWKRPCERWRLGWLDGSFRYSSWFQYGFM